MSLNDFISKKHVSIYKGYLVVNNFKGGRLHGATACDVYGCVSNFFGPQISKVTINKHIIPILGVGISFLKHIHKYWVNSSSNARLLGGVVFFCLFLWSWFGEEIHHLEILHDEVPHPLVHTGARIYMEKTEGKCHKMSIKFVIIALDIKRCGTKHPLLR